MYSITLESKFNISLTYTQNDRNNSFMNFNAQTESKLNNIFHINTLYKIGLLLLIHYNAIMYTLFSHSFFNTKNTCLVCI